MEPQKPDHADASTQLTRLAIFAGVLFAAWKLLPLLGAAQTGPDPKAVITGPEHATVGSFVELRGDTSIGGTSYEWEVTPKLAGVIQFELIGDGKNIRPATIPGTYTYRLSVWNAKKKSDAFHTLKVEGLVPPQPQPAPQPADPVIPKPDDPVKPVDPPSPAPKPVDPPTPKPAILEGTAKAIYDFATKLGASSRAEWCPKLAERCRAIAKRIEDKKVTLRAAAAVELGDAMKDLPPEWDDFRSKAGAYLHGLWTQGQLKDVAAIRSVVLAAADGFDAAAKAE